MDRKSRQFIASATPGCPTKRAAALLVLMLAWDRTALAQPAEAAPPEPPKSEQQPPADDDTEVADSEAEGASEQADDAAEAEEGDPAEPTTSDEAEEGESASETATGEQAAGDTREEEAEGKPPKEASSPEAEMASPSATPLGASSPAPVAGEGDLSAGLEDLSLVELFKLDLRVATTKTNTTIQATPAAVTVISRKQIERYGYRSVADALRDVVGTYFVDDHITPNLGVRGAPGTPYEGSGAVKVMIDSVPVSFRTTGEAWIGPSLVPMNSVERIEIVKGPTSSLYGADAFMGVINVITREGAQKTWADVGVTGMTTYGGGPGVHAEAATEVVMRPFRLSLAAQIDQEDRSGLAMPGSSPAPRIADTQTGLSQEQVLRSGVTTFKLSHAPNRKTSYSLTGRYAQQKTAAEFAPWLQFTSDPGQETGTWTSLHQGTLTLKAGSSFTREFRLEATGTGFFGGTLPDDRIDTGDSLATLHRDLAYAGGEGTVEAILEPSDQLRFVLGIEGSADREHLGAPDYFSRDDGSPLPPAGVAEDFDTTLFNIAGRAQATWELIDEYLVPTGGLRFDHNSVYGDKVSGRIAIVSHVYKELYLKASYGTAFKAATPLLLYGQPLAIGGVIGNPDLGAQEMRAFELTADYRPKKIADFELTISAWDLIDRAVFRPEQINLVARNAANATGWTLEGQANSTFSDYVGGSLGFELVRVTQQSGEIGYRGDLFGTAPSIYPEFITRGRLWVQPHPAPIEIWLASNVVGRRNASDSNTLEAGDRYVLPTYVTLDAGVRTVDLHLLGDRKTEFSLRAQNLTDTAGSAAGFFGIDYPAAPPKVMLEARQEF